jgi:hypothetical protein
MRLPRQNLLKGRSCLEFNLVLQSLEAAILTGTALGTAAISGKSAGWLRVR